MTLHSTSRLRSTFSLFHGISFQDVERSRNVIEQTLFLVMNQKESVRRVISPVVERSRNDNCMVRSTTSLFHRNTFQDVERSRNVIEQELCLVENQKESVLRVKIPVVERSRNDLPYSWSLSEPKRHPNVHGL